MQCVGTITSVLDGNKAKVDWEGAGLKWDTALLRDIAPLNAHDQADLGPIGRRSDSHPFASLHKMQCTICGMAYGANSCDVHLRKCPNCHGGQPGEPLE